MRVKSEGPKQTEMQFKAFQIKANEINEDGTFGGYALTYDDPMGPGDSYGDVIKPGACVEWLSQMRGKSIPMLFNHNRNEPIGKFLIDEMEDTAQGLKVKGRLTLKVKRAAEVRELMRDEVLGGLSIGYYVLAWEAPPVDSKAAFILTKLSIFEVSAVTFPANTDATYSDVKQSEPPVISLEAADILAAVSKMDERQKAQIAAALLPQTDNAPEQATKAVEITTLSQAVQETAGRIKALLA